MRRWIVYSLVLYLSCASNLWAQSFQNLDFEQASLSPIPSNQFGWFVLIADAMPGWTGYLGTNQVMYVLQNNTTLGAASIDINSPYFLSSLILEGQYTAALVAGTDPATNNQNLAVNASLAQVGLIPTNSKSILLEVAGNNFTVSFAGQIISLSPIGSGPNYTLFGGDISSFAGQVGELRMSTLSPLGSGVLFDAITFSSQVIPEPSALSLLAIGVAGLVLLHRSHRKTA